MPEQLPKSETEQHQEVVDALREDRGDKVELLTAWIDSRPEGPAEEEAAARHRIETYHIPLAQLYEEAGLLDDAWEAWYDAIDAAEQAGLSELIPQIQGYMANPVYKPDTSVDSGAAQ